jgi:aerobic carbon-monoxide dehydrogenase medium subunit
LTEYFEPRTLHEACELLQRYGEDARLLAGGTALVLFMRQGLLDPACLINIQHIPELAGIGLFQNSAGKTAPSPVAGEASARGAAASPSPLAGEGWGGGCRIGALTTHAQAARFPLIRDHYPALADTFHHVATPRIRNAGTIGGNLAHGDPHLDPPVTLLALNARVAAHSTRGRRELPISDLFRDYYETSMAPDEILTEVLLPPPAPRSGAAFIKFLPRSQDDYATVDIAAWVRLADASAARLDEVRIALGSVGPIPFRATGAEAVLRGESVSDEALAEAGERAAAACDPEDDVRGSAAYKREIVKVLVRRAVRQAVDAAAESNHGGAG